MEVDTVVDTEIPKVTSSTEEEMKLPEKPTSTEAHPSSSTSTTSLPVAGESSARPAQEQHREEAAERLSILAVTQLIHRGAFVVHQQDTAGRGSDTFIIEAPYPDDGTATLTEVSERKRFTFYNSPRNQTSDEPDTQVDHHHNGWRVVPVSHTGELGHTHVSGHLIQADREGLSTTALRYIVFVPPLEVFGTREAHHLDTTYEVRKNTTCTSRTAATFVTKIPRKFRFSSTLMNTTDSRRAVAAAEMFQATLAVPMSNSFSSKRHTFLRLTTSSSMQIQCINASVCTIFRLHSLLNCTV
jgi:hypothetical protein